MNPEYEFNHEYETSTETVPKTYHPELHDPAVEVRLDAVESIAEHGALLHDLPTIELESFRPELSELPEVVEYKSEPVKIDFWRRQFADLPEGVRAKKINPNATVGMMLDSVMSMLTDSISRYAETVRQFKSAELMRFHLEPDDFREYMQRVDVARRRAHEAMHSSANAVSRAVTQKVPNLLTPQLRQSWETDAKRHWFDHSRLGNRKAIGEWAIRTEMFEKSQMVIAAITEILEKKNEANP